MSEDEVAHVLDLALQRPVAYHRAFAQIAGKACAAVMLSQAWYWTPRAKKLSGWFYKSRKEWTEETGLTRTEQETARRRLIKLGILEEELRGMPATMHFRIDKTRVISLLAENLPTGRQETRKQVGGKATNKMAEKPPTITESTTESSADISLLRAPRDNDIKKWIPYCQQELNEGRDPLPEIDSIANVTLRSLLFNWRLDAIEKAA